MTIAETQSQVQWIWRNSFQYELDDALHKHLRQSALVGVHAALEAALAEELQAHLGFAPYARLASGEKPPEQHRSGFFRRQVTTAYGHIPDLRVPKLRCGNKARPWHILVRYQSTQRSLLDKTLYLYSMGLSMRDLQEGLYLFMGRVLSRPAINRITYTVRTKMDAWRKQPLTATPPILIVDGVWVKILYPTGATWTDRRGRRRRKMRKYERVILVTLAVWPDGHYHILHYEVAADENYAAWSTFFQHLIERGLDPAVVQVVVSDGSNGLLEAMVTHVPHAALQRCVVHKVRGFERYLSYKDLPTSDAVSGQTLTPAEARRQRRHAITSEALEIFQATTRAEAEVRLTAFVARWETVEPKAVHNFTWGIKRCFTFYQLDASLHDLTRSTNLAERFFREFRNKSDEIGTFPNEDSCLTIFHLVMVREHAKHRRFDFAKTG